MVEQGLEVMSVWLNIILSLCCLAGSDLPEVFIFLLPWSAFECVPSYSQLNYSACHRKSWLRINVNLTSSLSWPRARCRGLFHSLFFGCHLTILKGFWNWIFAMGPGCLPQKMYLGLWGPLPPSMSLTSTVSLDLVCATPAYGPDYAFI